MRKLLAALVLCTASLAFGQTPATRPEPALASAAWNLHFKFHDPQRLSVVEPGQSEPTVYWYMLYTVENQSDQELFFYPEFQIVTDTMQVVTAGKDVSPEAYQAAFRRANDPLLLPPERIAGRILRGKDRARHGVAIWRDFDPKARGFTVHVAGLSGEVMRWKNPAFNPDKAEGPSNQRYFLLRKTLAIPYTLPGSEASRATSIPRRQPEGQKWVMR
ncbi:MAG TPA: hypothetical protein PLQ89_09865 [Phycisphaerae bacterium]|nr:hypothetical protein [Phycisphaerae bacterium]HOJ75832.1 hypothetical protein [Phycisphaerae bacterium]HOM53218.1 hypothetical protein [Phycisphaerae bacterium]HON66691.1 hypothetical protein [Phycisphaerae bacterium]HOQ86014.1 hypothetical protein [Phycisphaerae bacterium]